MSGMARLPSVLTRGILNHPGSSPESRQTAERLLEQDRETYHCFYGPGFHNHLSHHVLAAYDLGAPPKLIHAIYVENANDLNPIDMDRETGTLHKPEMITRGNWTKYLGQEVYYASFLSFFTVEVAANGPVKTMEDLVFAPSASENGNMLVRFVGGAFHPFIQTGYGAESGSDAMIAQGLAQAAVHSANMNVLFGPVPDADTSRPRLTLLEILRQAYDSPILKPVMPYDPNAFLSARMRDVCKDGRPEEIHRLVELWFSSNPPAGDIEKKVEEMFWMATLLLAGTSKPNRKPRLDFFLMHVLNASIFLPSLMQVIPKAESQDKLLRGLLTYVFLYIEIRGRPRIDPELIMTYTATPRPPVGKNEVTPDPSTLGDPRDPEYVNPWPAMIASAIHSPDAHTVKATRSLYFAAQRYGCTKAGDVPGAFGGPNREETHKGLRQVDGTVFVRAAGIVLDTVDWTTYGQTPGHWDTSGLGWHDAWKNGE